VSIRVDEGTTEQQILADEEALRGALINLFRNGAEAMPDGGEIRVTIVPAVTENRPVRGPASGVRDDSGVVQVHVVDQGPGVVDAIATRIFDPFVTTKARGNGFGLALALRAAEANGGTIRLERGEPGSGAHFVLELPIHHPVREE
jgi:two-component system sensor kinase FixL